MILNVKMNGLLAKDLLVREPVDMCSEKIIKNNSKKIVLTGGYGVGKSIVISNLIDKTSGTNNPVIETYFDLIGTLDNVFSEEFKRHYYEVLFSFKLLNYIRKYYSITYEENFLKYNSFIYQNIKEIDEYINKYFYEKRHLNKYYNTKEISSFILEKFKECKNLNFVSLSINKFDRINNSNLLTQKILSEYFDMFDKVIITSNDERLKDKEFKSNDIFKDYLFMDINYGKNIFVIREIIKKRIEQSDKKNLIDFDKYSDEICKILIEKTNGNINLMIYIINKMFNIISFKGPEKASTMDNFLYACTDQIENDAKIKKMSKPCRLYI